jgi:phosphate-selective porin
VTAGRSRLSSRHRVLLLAASLALPVAPAAGQATPPVQPAPAPTSQTDADDATRLVFTNGRPTLRIGTFADIQLRGRLETTSRRPDSDVGLDATGLQWRTRRLQVEGTVLRRIEFEVSREFGDSEEPERDAFVNLRLSRPLEVQAGRFKVPFGRDTLTGGANLDFVYRSLVGRQISPGRDVGVMAHGRLGRTVSYEAGLFRRDGDNARTVDTHGGNEAHAARVVVAPFASRNGSPLEDLEFGAAIMRSRLDDALGLRGRTVFGDGEFFDRVFVNGRRLRRGVEGFWAAGPVSISGEYVSVSDERLGMGLSGEALPSVHAAGWYLAGTWTVTGERKNGRVNPRRSLFQGGAGAVEVAVRLERLAFDQVSHPGTRFDAPLTEKLAPNGERVLTLGTAWYPNRYAKVLGNLVFEVVDDPSRSPAPRDGRFTSAVLLLQFAL